MGWGGVGWGACGFAACFLHLLGVSKKGEGGGVSN